MAKSMKLKNPSSMTQLRQDRRESIKATMRETFLEGSEQLSVSTSEQEDEVRVVVTSCGVRIVVIGSRMFILKVLVR